MCVIRRIDAVLESTKMAVLDTKKMLDEASITEQCAALCDASGQAFYNNSNFKLRDLKSRGTSPRHSTGFRRILIGCITSEYKPREWRATKQWGSFSPAC